MRVHSLSLTAFGPFADTVEVDFDDAGRDGLFLLWGPTGAGKTTLLDGVVYALYGTVPGARGEERRLRSDHAGDAVRTEVTCEVTLGRRARPRGPPARAAAAEEARQRVDDRAGEAHGAALGGGHVGAGQHPHRRGVGVPAHPAGSLRRAVLPGRAAPAGRLRPLPPCRARGPGAAAAHPVRRRPVRPRRGVARHRARHGPRRAGDRPGLDEHAAGTGRADRRRRDPRGAGPGARGRRARGMRRPLGVRRPDDGADPAHRGRRPRPRPPPTRRRRSTPS